MNGKKLYVGGLPYATSDRQLEELFSDHGTVESARVITDRFDEARRWAADSQLPDEAKAILARFIDDENGGFFDTPTDHEKLITRPRDVFDNATPSGNSVTAPRLARRRP